MITGHTLRKPLFHSRICHYPIKVVAMRVAIETAILALLAFAAMSGIAQANPAETPVITPQNTTSLPTTSAPLPPSQPESGDISVKAVVDPAKSVVPQCSRGVMPNPAPLALNLKQSGVTRVVDSPSYYKVNGNTIDQAKRQIAQCSPIENGKFAAVTVSTINWQFAYYRDPWTNQCKLSNVAVGVHTGFLYPSWSNANQTWHTFIQNTVTHEQGHAERDLAAANAILADLQAIPFSDCATIANTANTLANTRVEALRQENTAYDAHTNHGATQGAHF